jgi:hypothetical protein
MMDIKIIIKNLNFRHVNRIRRILLKIRMIVGEYSIRKIRNKYRDRDRDRNRNRRIYLRILLKRIIFSHSIRVVSMLIVLIR